MKGIDISSNNHSGGVIFNFGEVKAAGYDCVWVKATQGNNYLNPYLIGDVRDAANNGLKVGVYHFYSATAGTVEEQAEWFLHNGILQPEEGGRTVADFCTLHPVFDYEQGTPTKGIIERFISALGLPCGTYLNRSFYSAVGYGDNAAFGWLAWPGWTDQALPQDTAVVQTGQQPVQGIPTNCDIDVIVNASVIGADTQQQPLTVKEEYKMLQVTIDGVEYVVTTVLTADGHIVEIRRTLESVGKPSNAQNTSLIDLTVQWPAELG